MTYNPSKPAPNDLLSDSQLDIQTNFSVANTSFGKNHFPFDDATVNNGKHKFVQMPNSAALPAGLAALEGTLYTKLNSTVSELYYSPDASTDEYQLTRTISASFATFATNPGWSFLPGGLLIQFGSVSASSAGTAITFPVTFTSAVYSLTIGITNTSGARISSISNSGATFVNNGSGPTTVYWTVIGK